MPVDKIGDEFLVNTTTEDNQLRPSVAGLLDGGFVAIWEDIFRSSDEPRREEIRGQAYGTDGPARGEEFMVNTTTGSIQGCQSVTRLECRLRKTRLGALAPSSIHPKQGIARHDQELTGTILSTGIDVEPLGSMQAFR